MKLDDVIKCLWLVFAGYLFCAVVFNQNFGIIVSRDQYIFISAAMIAYLSFRK